MKRKTLGLNKIKKPNLSYGFEQRSYVAFLFILIERRDGGYDEVVINLRNRQYFIASRSRQVSPDFIFAFQTRYAMYKLYSLANLLHPLQRLESSYFDWSYIFCSYSCSWLIQNFIQTIWADQNLIKIGFLLIFGLRL